MRLCSFRGLALAVAAAVLPATFAHADKSALSKELLTKSSSVSEIASVVAKTGSVNVIVLIDIGLSGRSLDAALAGGASRDRTKANISRALNAVIADHFGSVRSAGRHLAKFSTTPGFAVSVSAAELNRLAADPRVTAINYDLPIKANLDRTVPFIGMSTVYIAGGTGVGRTVVVLDQGVQRDHQVIGVNRVIREACFLHVATCPNGTTEQIGAGAAEAADATVDHGTHVAGIVLGNQAAANTGPTNGVAKAARLFHITVLDNDGSGLFSNVQRGIEHLEDIVIAQNNTLKIDAFNMSLGGGSYPGNCDSVTTMGAMKAVIDRLLARGVLGAIAAGNSYSRASVSAPGCISSVLTVSATSRSGVPASYTNISPVTDVWAPGGDSGDCVESSIPNNRFAQFCGTSMAAPHVAGAIAALRSKVPTASVCRIEDALKSTGVALRDNRSGGTITKPRIRVDQALRRLLAPVAPANNAFASATLVPATFSSLSLDGSNIGATLETRERRHVVSTSDRSVWWRWTPTTSGAVTISTAGSSFDTVLAVYTGAAVTALGTPVAGNDNVSSTDLTSKVTFNAVAGTTYRIVVAGKTGTQQCAIQLNFQRPPANDNFLAARTVAVTATAEIGVGGTNVGSGKESGEPDHNGNSSHRSSVWFKFTAPVSGPISIDTEGSPLFDTVLAVYTGTSVRALTLVTSDDDSGSNAWSMVTFNMVAGTQYKVAVVGYGGSTGRFRLWFTPAGAQRANRAVASIDISNAD